MIILYFFILFSFTSAYSYKAFDVMLFLDFFGVTFTTVVRVAGCILLASVLSMLS